MKKIILSFLLLLGAFVPSSLLAQTEQKIYQYDSIDTTIAINANTTFTVEERQTFDYQQGTFHQGWRSIPLAKVGSITDVVVIDGATGAPLQWSPQRLEKTNPDSWGRYTTYRQNGALNIEWYYDLADTQHLWILRYTVHGGLEFYDTNDRLYWNLFSDYDVPVGVATAVVSFPPGVTTAGMRFDAYRTNAQPIISGSDLEETIYFEIPDVSPGEAVTIDVAFPRGIVQESAFWKDWFMTNYGLVGSALAVLLGILFLVSYWYRTERHGKGRGIIIAQYEPPKQLRPAMAEVVTKEMITEKAWPATIVDLAVRGYISITEEEVDRLTAIGGIVVLVIFFGILSFFVMMAVSTSAPFIASAPLIIFAIFLIITLSRAHRIKGGVARMLAPKTYAITKIKEYADDSAVEEYEKMFLDNLFSRGDVFSLKTMKRSPALQQAFAKRLEKIKEVLYTETDMDTRAFENSASKAKYFYLSVGAIIFGYPLLAQFASAFFGQAGLLGSTLVAVLAFIVAFIKFEPRLSHEGHLLREDWLGFKLYLETAERYRMQNLTPEIFEKYLPYAMIFGIEKKWAKAFEGMTMQPPAWYGGSVHAGSITASSATSFSPVSFSSSFSTSFASAFSSSSGSGGGGGGGSAGGGGGGGGGGAS